MPPSLRSGTSPDRCCTARRAAGALSPDHPTAPQGKAGDHWTLTRMAGPATDRSVCAGGGVAFKPAVVAYSSKIRAPRASLPRGTLTPSQSGRVVLRSGWSFSFAPVRKDRLIRGVGAPPARELREHHANSPPRIPSFLLSKARLSSPPKEACKPRYYRIPARFRHPAHLPGAVRAVVPGAADGGLEEVAVGLAWRPVNPAFVAHGARSSVWMGRRLS